MEIERQEFVCNAFTEDLETQCRHNIFKIYNDKIGFYAECQKCKKYARINISFILPTIDFDVQGGKVKYLKKEVKADSSQ